ncbi:hypothetical protein FJW08_21295 [Mesorhizobium sp. B3-2-1]|uniref:peroxidase family protein n=1 Tax=Mesorhizobium sp. B3-2-1 TaxID=2589891 RepID=UPI00112A6B2A|nr:peroxidase family protein [Mesorhizobium sp. B3-2-1]TPI28312.1 hypothetical protein FJW08_21295 [Mesorhizobium sp. B3-2-1]
MNAHRGTGTAGPTLRGDVRSIAATVDPRQVEFRNFGYAGGADEAKLYHGLETPWATQCLLAKLLRRMSAPPALATDTTNEHIPAGYTYLAQLAAHDIIRNSSLNPLLAANEAGRRNEREQALLLDVLYGEGPSSNPSLYALPKPGEGVRSMMRTGPMAPPSASAMAMPAGACPFALRDLPRFQPADLSDGFENGRTDVLVGDQRSDDNANIAQMTALFLHLHNAVAAALSASGLPRQDIELPAGAYLFDRARRVTTAVYRCVLQNDLLPRLIAKPIWDLYQANGFRPLVDMQPQGVPIEFSHAAFRLGHAMIRLSYVFNDQHPEGEGLENVLLNRSSSRPHKFPISEHWIADWSHFFEIAGSTPQFSRRIGPTVNEVLLSAYTIPILCVGPDSKALDSTAAGLLNQVDRGALPDPNASGLLFSDLVRGTIGGLLRLDALIEKLPQTVLATAPLLGEATKRSQAIQSWLQGSTVTFTAAELAELAENPPLLFWLLFEAAIEQTGLCFGTTGSVIVGDVFMARFAASRATIEDDPITQDLVARLFPTGIPRTMPDLIVFVANTLNLSNAWPRFISPSTTPGA